MAEVFRILDSSLTKRRKKMIVKIILGAVVVLALLIGFAVLVVGGMLKRQ